MPILFDNRLDTTDKSVDPVVVGTPHEFVLVQGESVNIFRDGVLVARLSQPQQRYEAVAIGTYTFSLPDFCTRPTIIDASELFESINGTLALDTVQCDGGQDSGSFSVSPVVDVISSVAAPFPSSYQDGTTAGVGGRPFGGFPWLVSPTTGNGGMFFSSQQNSNPTSACEDTTVTNVSYQFTFNQIRDSDNNNGDVGDHIFLLELDGQSIPSTAVTSSGSINSIGDFQFSVTTEGLDTTVTISATDPSSLTLDEASRVRLGVAVQLNDESNLISASRIIGYDVESTCSTAALFTKDCNSDASLAALGRIEQAINDSVRDDFEFDFQDWTRDAGTGTWVRTTDVYENGVLRPDLQQTIDSGVPVSEPQPTDSEYVTSSTKLCNDDGEWMVLNVFDVSDTASPLSTTFINPLGVVSADPLDLAPCPSQSVQSPIGVFCYDDGTDAGTFEVYAIRDQDTSQVSYFRTSDNSLVTGGSVVECPRNEQRDRFEYIGDFCYEVPEVRQTVFDTEGILPVSELSANESPFRIVPNIDWDIDSFSIRMFDRSNSSPAVTLTITGAGLQGGSITSAATALPPTADSVTFNFPRSILLAGETYQVTVSGADASARLNTVNTNFTSEVLINSFVIQAPWMLVTSITSMMMDSSAYGILNIEDGSVQYFDKVSNAEVTNIVDCQADPIEVVRPNDTIHTPDGITLTQALPQFPDWGFGDIGISTVRSFTVFNTSEDDVRVAFGNNRDIFVPVGAGLTWGDPDSDTRLDVSMITISYESDSVGVIWEN